jgi:hypothetical protein
MIWMAGPNTLRVERDFFVAGVFQPLYAPYDQEGAVHDLVCFMRRGLGAGQ